jgi:carbon-monoxide dehydrogenase small subunit
MLRLKSDARHAVTLQVNGQSRSGQAETRWLLSDFLRHELGLYGTHVGCEHGVCGACTVMVDGRAVRSCTQFAVECDGSAVRTVEGLAGQGELGILQQAFRRHHALQCGFCTPGMLIGAQDLLKGLLGRGGVPSRDAIREHLSGNYCRCTGYQAIVDAIESVAQLRAGKAG